MLAFGAADSAAFDTDGFVRHDIARAAGWTGDDHPDSSLTARPTLQQVY